MATKHSITDAAITSEPQLPSVGAVNAWNRYLATVAASLGLLLIAYGAILGVLDHQWQVGFYFSQFDPISLARNALHIRAMREARDPFNTVEMTAYGDGPLRSRASLGLVYGRIKGYDDRCFAALRSLAASVTA